MGKKNDSNAKINDKASQKSQTSSPTLLNKHSQQSKAQIPRRVSPKETQSPPIKKERLRRRRCKSSDNLSGRMPSIALAEKKKEPDRLRSKRGVRRVAADKVEDKQHPSHAKATVPALRRTSEEQAERGESHTNTKAHSKPEEYTSSSDKGSRRRRPSNRGRSPGRHRRGRSPGALRRENCGSQEYDAGEEQRRTRRKSTKENGETGDVNKQKEMRSIPEKRCMSPGKYCARALSPGKYRGLSPGKYQPRVAEDIVKRYRSASLGRLTTSLDDSTHSTTMNPKRNTRRGGRSERTKMKRDLLVQSEHSPATGPRYFCLDDSSKGRHEGAAWLRRRRAHDQGTGKATVIDRTHRNKPRKTRSNEELRQVANALLHQQQEQKQHHVDDSKDDNEDEDTVLASFEGKMICFPQTQKKREQRRRTRIAKSQGQRAPQTHNHLHQQSKEQHLGMKEFETAPRGVSTKVRNAVSYFETLSHQHSRGFQHAFH